MPLTDADSAEPRHFPQQRAAKTYTALLHAATTLFAERGYEDVQTPEIAAAAGVATGTFYRYFTDKRHIFLEVIERHLVEIHEEMEARITQERFFERNDADVHAVVDEVIEAIFLHTQRHAKITRVYLALSLSDPDVMRLRSKFEAREQANLAGIIAGLMPHRPAEASALAIRLMVTETALAWVGVRPGLHGANDADALKAVLRELVCAYLFGQRVCSGPRGP